MIAVYVGVKRQSILPPLVKNVGYIIIFWQTGEVKRVLFSVQTDDPSTVSYTHLDVYKRQLKSCSDVGHQSIM